MWDLKAKSRAFCLSFTIINYVLHNNEKMYFPFAYHVKYFWKQNTQNHTVKFDVLFKRSEVNFLSQLSCSVEKIWVYSTYDCSFFNYIFHL